jgi:hypothetical protein
VGGARTMGRMALSLTTPSCRIHFAISATPTRVRTGYLRRSMGENVVPSKGEQGVPSIDARTVSLLGCNGVPGRKIKMAPGASDVQIRPTSAPSSS